jgi:LmbE family N-acetylglucosaminyl deacetylase
MNVLAIGCHPDDLEIACSGTLRKYVGQGATVYMCHVANGDQGHVVIEPEPLAALRAEEARKAAMFIGAKEIFSICVSDMQVNSHDQARIDAVADVVRITKPDVIITHNPVDYMQDHVETSHLATNGGFMSGLPHRSVNHAAFQSFIPTFFMDTLAGVDFSPSHYVDISGQIERKLQALTMHESQVKWMLEHDDIDFLDMVRTCSRYRGYQCGVAYAEAFRPYNVYPRHSTKHLLP